MTAEARSAALELIRTNIAKFGHHKYVIFGGAVPRFVYSIGLSESVGSELIVAGCSFYSVDEVRRIMDAALAQLAELPPVERLGAQIEVDSLGGFSLREVDTSWCRFLLLGALDFYSVDRIAALQIVPDKDHWTIDIPVLDRPFNALVEPVWRWVQEPWLFPVPENSTVVTNLAALRGKTLTEVARWEPGEWEMFAGAGPDVASEDVRTVPLGTLVGADQSLEEIVKTLEVGGAVWREPGELCWHPWSAATAEND